MTQHNNMTSPQPLLSMTVSRPELDVCGATTFRDLFAKHGDTFFDGQHQQQQPSLTNSNTSFDADSDVDNGVDDGDLFDQGCYDRFAASLRNVSTRVKNLLQRLDDEAQKEQREEDVVSSSPVRDACRRSLSTTMPLILEKVSLYVDNIDEGGSSSKSISTTSSSSKRMIAKLRATFALINCVQYLDTIESGLSSNSRNRYDEVMKSVLTKIRSNPLIDDQFKAKAHFRVSHWVAPTLAFDIPAGDMTSATAAEGEGDSTADSLPISLRVEPVISFGSEDLITGKKGSKTFRRCAVIIEKCHHKSKEFAEGAGTIGVADVRVKVFPLDEGAKRARIWGEKEGDRLCVTEARV